MVYRSPTGLPRLDLILGTETDDPATARTAFTYGTDDFFANAFDASTAGNKSGVQLNAAEADEQRQREEDEWEALRDGMAELAYLQEQITIGGITMTVAEHGRLGKRLTEDAAFRSAVSAKMKADNPNLTDAQIDTAMDQYSEWARLKNIPPGKRTEEENERLRQLEPVVRADPTVGEVVTTARNYTENLNVQQEAAVQQLSHGRTNSARVMEIKSTRASLTDDAAPFSSQASSPTAQTAATQPSASGRSDLQAAFAVAADNTPMIERPQNAALATDAAAVVQQQYVVSASI